MKNQGFTLVELITVISLLAIIGLISMPIVDGVVKRSKEKVYNAQIEDIKNQAKKYVTENSYLVPDTGFFVCLRTLKQEGYLENIKIVDPRNDKAMNGKVNIEYQESSKSYLYDYIEDNTGCFENSIPN